MHLARSAVLAAGLLASIPALAQSPASEPDDWRGAYLGLNLGYGVGTAAYDSSATASSTALGPNGLLSQSGKSSVSGGLIGGQVGYNWRLASPWLIGAEADWQLSTQKGSTQSCTPAGNLTFFGAGGNGFGYCLNNEQKIENFGTLRFRAGQLVRDNLLYVTGGLAWGTVKERVAFSTTSNPTIFPFAGGAGPYSADGSSSHMRTGWTVGFGLETKLTTGWSVKMEYLHVDLGSHTQTTAMNINPAFGAGFTAGGSGAVTTSTRITDDLLRIGLNYQFGR